MVTSLWASKFATAEIECIFEMGKQAPLGCTIYFAIDITLSAYNLRKVI